MIRKSTGKHLINKHGFAVHTNDLLMWGRNLEKNAPRFRLHDLVGNYRVSTIFIGLDYNFTLGPPLLWETMVFDESIMDNSEDALLGSCARPLGQWRFQYRKDAYNFHNEKVKELINNHKECNDA